MDSDKRVLICPKCHQFYSTNRSPQHLRCSDCHTGPLDPVDISYEEYVSFTHEQKEAFKLEYIASHYPAGMTVVHTPYEPISDNKWSGFVQAICWLSLAVIFIAGIGIVLNGSVLGGVALILGGFVAISGCMLFASIADDIRAIRNSIDRYIHYHP